ncbi:hypothetical protein FS749_009457 [Ceratobasidium sp. UAMH 11750]|nr:hypothetical protein FS749_009457 [Ceratobasidium sp. UAMH 11750]
MYASNSVWLIFFSSSMDFGSTRGRGHCVRQTSLLLVAAAVQVSPAAELSLLFACTGTFVSLAPIIALTPPVLSLAATLLLVAAIAVITVTLTRLFRREFIPRFGLKPAASVNTLPTTRIGVWWRLNVVRRLVPTSLGFLPFRRHGATEEGMGEWQRASTRVHNLF